MLGIKASTPQDEPLPTSEMFRATITELTSDSSSHKAIVRLFEVYISPNTSTNLMQEQTS